MRKAGRIIAKERFESDIAFSVEERDTLRT